MSPRDKHSVTITKKYSLCKLSQPSQPSLPSLPTSCILCQQRPSLFNNLSQSRNPACRNILVCRQQSGISSPRAREPLSCFVGLPAWVYMRPITDEAHRILPRRLEGQQLTVELKPQQTHPSRLALCLPQGLRLPQALHLNPYLCHVLALEHLSVSVKITCWGIRRIRNY